MPCAWAKSFPAVSPSLKSSDLVLAFDVGTTTVAGSLLDLVTGQRLASAMRLNPQRILGADVVTRLAAAVDSPDNLQLLQSLINQELESLCHALLEMASIEPAAVSSVVVAGNSVMQHFTLGLPVTTLAFPPYRPVTPARCQVSTTELGWKLQLQCTVFPMPGGYVGGDLVAFLLGVEAERRQKTRCLCLDMGTNGEMAVTAGDRFFATSAAAGPAFEAGEMSCGMLALPGAISGVTLSHDRPEVMTIGGRQPQGICGSGLVATVSALLQAGIIDPTGRLLAAAEVPSNLANHLVEKDGEPSFILYRDARHCFSVSQKDIRQLQLAKSAIKTAIDVLLARAGLKEGDLQEIILTGSFGAVLSPQDLKNIGIFSKNMVDICRFVHEGALRGVERACLARDSFASLDRLSEAITVIPLSGTPAFEKNFFKNMNFPHQQAAA